MDKFGDHALTCLCAGDRTKRHNAIQNVLTQDCTLGNLRPVKEKRNLLPRRPTSDGIKEAVQAERNSRPADIWVPRGPNQTQTAFDIAVTSGISAGTVRNTLENPQLLPPAMKNIKEPIPHQGSTPLQRKCADSMDWTSYHLSWKPIVEPWVRAQKR